MKLLVSIHDVTPAHAANVRELWNLCRAIGVTPALLVVPNWHGRWPLDRHPHFTRWVRQCADEGADVLLHGERHDEHGSTRRFVDDMRAFGLTSSEGEFLTLDRDEARLRISRGLKMLRRCELDPVGFVPPAWLARPSCGVAAAECGLRISEDASSIYLHHRGTRLLSPVTRWSTRARWRAGTSRLVARARLALGRRTWLVRIALHPMDLSSAPVRRSIVQTMERWLAVRQPWRYSDL